MILAGATMKAPGQTSNNSKNKYMSTTNKQQVLIDKFFVPAGSIKEVMERMDYNRNFIKKLPGFVKDEIYEQIDENGNLNCVTIAVWQNEDVINKAKETVQAEYKRIGFNPADFYQKLGIKMDRGVYQQMEE